MAFESTEGSAPPPDSAVGRMAASLKTVAGSSVRQELEKGPLNGLKASRGNRGRLGREQWEAGSGERKWRRLIEDEPGSHLDTS